MQPSHRQHDISGKVWALLERQGYQLVEARIEAIYVAVGVLTILLLASERVPEIGIVTLFRG